MQLTRASDTPQGTQEVLSTRTYQSLFQRNCVQSLLQMLTMLFIGVY